MRQWADLDAKPVAATQDQSAERQNVISELKLQLANYAHQPSRAILGALLYLIEHGTPQGT